MINKDSVPRQHMSYYGLSMFMINKDGFSTQHMSYYGLSTFMINKDGFYRQCMSYYGFLPVERKRAEKMLEPADEGS